VLPAIQEGVIDWFSFWLTGREDPSPQSRRSMSVGTNFVLYKPRPSHKQQTILDFVQADSLLNVIRSSRSNPTVTDQS
jgi:hypothetical protein